MSSSSARCPAGLGSAGRAFWRSVTADFELEVDSLALLQQVCRMLDELEWLRVAITTADLVVEGSSGQPRPHPLLGELRAHRLTLGKLLAQLALPDEDDTPPLTATQQRARKAAQARWAGYQQRYGDGTSTA